MGFRACNSKGVDKNRAKCNMGFDSDTFTFFLRKEVREALSSANDDPCLRTSCTVVATGVKWTATPAEARGGWEGKPKAPEAARERGYPGQTGRGKHKNGMPANGPPCDLNSAFSVAQSLGLTVPSMRTPWTGSVAVRCHPWWGMPGSHVDITQLFGTEHPPKTPARKVRGNPADARCSPAARTPAKVKGRVLFMEGVHERKRLGVSGGFISKQSAQLAQKSGSCEQCGTVEPKASPDTVANWPDPSKCWQEQPREGG